MRNLLKVSFLSLFSVGTVVGILWGSPEEKESGRKAPKPFWISGRVLNQAGQGIGGAKILAFPEIGTPHSSMPEKLIFIPRNLENAGHHPAHGVSKEDGSYRIEGLEKNHYTLLAIAARYSPTEQSEILPSQDNVELRLAAGGVLTGNVVDLEGAPVEGAKVMAYTQSESADLFTIIQVRSRPPIESVVTSPGGQFRFEALGTGGYNFLVAAKGYQEGHFPKIKIQEGENRLRRFAIAKGLVISGTVVTSGRKPIAGAKVRAVRTGDTGRGDNSMIITFEDGSILTDDQGRFSFDTLEPGKYTLLAWHREFASEQRRDVNANSNDLVITLPLGGALSGVITEKGAGRPVAGARISVSDLQDLRKEGVSDDQGHYHIAGLNASGHGKHFLNIHADGYARLSNLQVRIEDGKTIENQNFELQRTAVVAGRVVNEGGKGLAEKLVMARRKSATSPFPLTVGSAITGVDGRYQIDDMEGGEETELTVISSDYLEARSAFFAVRAGETLELPDIHLKLGGSIQGIVVGPEGQPVRGVPVSVRKKGKAAPDPTLSATSDAQGRFLLQGLPTTTVDLVANSAHHLEETLSDVKVEEGNTTRDVRITLRKGNQVKGVVVDSAGEPVIGAEVIARDTSRDGFKEIRAQSGDDGSFLVENISSSESIEIEVRHPDCSSWTDNKVPVNTERLRVVLPKLPAVHGLVVDGSGKPITKFTVQLDPNGKAGERSPKPLAAKTFGPSPDGSFVYGSVPPGIYTVTVHSPFYAATTIQNVEVQSQGKDLGKVVLREGGRVNGVVVDQDRHPIAGASVRVIGGRSKFNLRAASNEDTARDPSLSSTDAQGTFKFHQLKGGLITLETSAKGYVTKRVENIDPDIAEKGQDLKIVLEPGAEVSGSVVDSEGKARSGVSVYVTRVGEPAGNAEFNQRVTSDQEGRFKFLGLAAGSYRVLAHQVAKAGAKISPVQVTLKVGEHREVKLTVE